MTMHPQPLLSVADVDVAAAFYAELLGGNDDHGGRHGGPVREYARIEIGDRLVLQLHAIQAAHHHGALAREGVVLGNGVAVWFAADDFDAAVDRVRALAGAEIVHDVHVNPNARQREIWLRDPDGYLVVLAEA